MASHSNQIFNLLYFIYERNIQIKTLHLSYKELLKMHPASSFSAFEVPVKKWDLQFPSNVITIFMHAPMDTRFSKDVFGPFQMADCQRNSQKHVQKKHEVIFDGAPMVKAPNASFILTSSGIDSI